MDIPDAAVEAAARAQFEWSGDESWDDARRARTGREVGRVMSATDRLTRVTARVRHGKECHEGVTREGEFQPCDKPAIALRDSCEADAYYPVCAYHARGFCVPLVDPDDAAALVAALHAVHQIAFDPDTISALEHGAIEFGPSLYEGVSGGDALSYARDALRDIRRAIEEA